MAYMRSIGYFLINSGWTALIYNAGIARSAIANSLLSGNDTVGTKYCNQVTSFTLNILLKKHITNTELPITPASTSLCGVTR